MSSKLVMRTLRWPRSPSTLNFSHNRSRLNPSIPSCCQSREQSLAAAHALRTALTARRCRQISLERRRTFLTESIPSVLVPPAVFAGLLLALWTWKCMMMVLFQDKIIYMPSMPPFARSEKMGDYTAICKPVDWEEEHIKSLDRTKIALCIGKIHAKESANKHMEDGKITKEVLICYFQGNGSSLPPRLPILSNVLKSVEARTASAGNTPVRYTVLALSYRGYWTSSGRASQAGIELDAAALLSFVSNNFAKANAKIELVLWGQSIGSGIATTAAARYISQQEQDSPRISALVLETPFTAVKSMLIALYPQKWLPYRYLWPLLWNRWDSEVAFRQIASSGSQPKVLILPATRDEVVPSEEADKLEHLCRELKFDFERKNVEGALHNEATVRRDGQEAIAKFIADVGRSK